MRYVIVVVVLTKFCETEAIASANAIETAEFFVKKVLLRHGQIKIMKKDKGTNFVSAMVRAVLRAFHTEHKTSIFCRPQSQGIVERLNHSLAQMISMYVNSDQKNWSEILSYITFAWNTTRHEATGFTSYFLMYNREAELPINLEFGVSPNPRTIALEKAEEYIAHLNERLQAAHQLVKNRLAALSEKRKERYDEGRHKVTYELGDLVLIYRPVRKVGKSDKLNHCFLGPYEVIQQLSSVNYEVQFKGKRKTEVVHVAQMKPFKEFIWHDDVFEEGEDLEDGTAVKAITKKIIAEPSVNKRGRPRKAAPPPSSIEEEGGKGEEKG